MDSHSRGIVQKVEHTLYDRCCDFDIAFSWDRTEEVQGLLEIFKGHLDGPVERVLEPACGPGRYGVTMAREGPVVTGYDLRPEMLALARARAEAEGLADRCRWVEGDMRDPPEVGEHDVAMTLVDSLGYLLTDEEITAHFEGTRRALRPGGIYVVQVSFLWLDLSEAEPAEWTGEEAGAQYVLRWQIDEEDRKRKISRQRCHVEIHEPGESRVIEEEHILRLWEKSDFLRLASAFERVSLWTSRFEELEWDTPLCGELGDIYVVLKKTA